MKHIVLALMLNTSFSAFAQLIECPKGEEWGSLQVRQDSSGRCTSGLDTIELGWNTSQPQYLWKNWHCVAPDSVKVTPGSYQSCFVYQDLGNGWGIVHIKDAIDGSLR